MTRRKINVIFEPQIFPEFTMGQGSGGMLNPHKACQALWYYACLQLTIEHRNNDNLRAIEGEWGALTNYFELFKSIATMYGVAPEEMTKWWRNVDLQMAMMGGKLRVKKEYRFADVPEIKTQ